MTSRKQPLGPGQIANTRKRTTPAAPAETSQLSTALPDICVARAEFRADHAKRHANLQHGDGGTFVSVRRLLRQIRCLVNIKVVISGRTGVDFAAARVDEAHAGIGDDVSDSGHFDAATPGTGFEGCR